MQRQKVKSTVEEDTKKPKREIKKIINTEPVTQLNFDDAEDVEVEDDIIETPGGTRKRRQVTPETVDTAFTEIISVIEAEISRQRDLKDKNNGRPQQGSNIKVLRSTLKKTKQLQNDTRRIARKKRGAREGNTNSGFMKEVPISDEMAEFIGVDKGSIISRVQCTKNLHKYILKHDLQNPTNRREIIPDQELSDLLGYDAEKDGKLFYYVMQMLIQKHFVKQNSDTPKEKATVAKEKKESEPKKKATVAKKEKNESEPKKKDTVAKKEKNESEPKKKVTAEKKEKNASEPKKKATVVNEKKQGDLKKKAAVVKEEKKKVRE